MPKIIQIHAKSLQLTFCWKKRLVDERDNRRMVANWKAIETKKKTTTFYTTVVSRKASKNIQNVKP